MAQAPLLIIYQWVLRNVAFLLLHVPWVAVWLWTKPQAEQQNPCKKK